MTSNTNQPEPSEQLDDDQDSFQEVMAILGAKHQCLHEDCDTFHHLPKRQQAEAILNWHNQAIAQAVQAAEAAAAVQLRKDNDFIRMVKREAVREERRACDCERCKSLPS